MAIPCRAPPKGWWIGCQNTILPSEVPSAPYWGALSFSFVIRIAITLSYNCQNCQSALAYNPESR